MPTAPSPHTVLVAYLVEGALLLAGLVLLWRLAAGPAARARVRATPSPLAPWRPPTADFLLYLLVIVGGALVGSAAVGSLAAWFGAAGDTRLILGTAGLQIGLMLAALLLPLRAAPNPVDPAALRSGAATFLVALPLVTGVTFLWTHVLQFCGVATDQQDIVRLFLEIKSPALLALMIVLPTVVAPFGEELLFRATLFRFLRGTALPRAVVLGLPAVIFASFHLSLVAFAPLVILAVVFALAFERTGRIGTTIVAHALFNLHTVVLLLAGLNS